MSKTKDFYYPDCEGCYDCGKCGCDESNCHGYDDDERVDNEKYIKRTRNQKWK